MIRGILYFIGLIILFNLDINFFIQEKYYKFPLDWGVLPGLTGFVLGFFLLWGMFFNFAMNIFPYIMHIPAILIVGSLVILFFFYTMVLQPWLEKKKSK